MEKTKSAPKKTLPALADGQLWRVAEMNLQVNRVGPHLVQYKLGKPGAVRVPNSLDSKATLEKYLRQNKGVLQKIIPPPAAKSAKTKATT